MSNLRRARLFGAALDYLDDPERLGLKSAFVNAESEDRLPCDLPRDPYDAIAPLVLSGLNSRATLCGKIELPGAFTPRPQPEDRPYISQQSYQDFMDAGGPSLVARSCGKTALSVLPDIPVMIGVDHCVSHGPVSALASQLGMESLAVVVLDSHFDAIPAELRSGEPSAAKWGRGLCGDFLAGLLDDGLILPERLFVVGAGDFPGNEATKSDFGQAYLRRIESGVKVYTRTEAQSPGFLERLSGDIVSSGAKSLYVSLDADVGAFSCMNAVRFYNGVGLSEEQVLSIGRELGRLTDVGRVELAGVDVCEIDVHLLGLFDEQGRHDRTAEVCADFVLSLLGNNLSWKERCHDHIPLQA